MVSQITSLNLTAASTTRAAEEATSQLREEYEAAKALFQLQSPETRWMLETQARTAAEWHLERGSRIEIHLPERVIIYDPEPVERSIPRSLRQQSTGGRMSDILHRDKRSRLSRLLADLELGDDQGAAAVGRLIRYLAAEWMIHEKLPAGRMVVYEAAEGDDIQHEPGEGGFYLPEWAFIDAHSQSMRMDNEAAEAGMEKMKAYMETLQAAVSLAPYMAADPEYQSKRYGMLGQLVNQGRAYARYETEEIIQRLKRRATAQELNMGLRLRLPYFDDQRLQMRLWDFQAIPAGRLMFVPAFVVIAAHDEKARAARNSSLNSSTRKHLMNLLTTLEVAFI